MNIINIDENNNVIDPVDGNIGWREYVTEETADNGGINIISHCRKFTTEELQEQLRNDLAATATDDLEVAICELAEQQALYESDVNAALCELYELITGGE